LIIVLLSLAATRTEAARVLYDFERPEDLAAIDIRGDSMQPLKDYISLDERYATSGENALRIQVPVWNKDMPPALWMHIPLPREKGEMGRYDRVVMEVTNPTANDLPWVTAFHGPAKPARYANVLPARSFRRFVIRLNTLTTRDSAEGFSRMEPVFWKPKHAVDVHIDRILLLEPGEPIPPTDPDKLAPQREMIAEAYAGIEPRIAALQTRTRTVGEIAPAVVPYAETWIADLRAGLAQLQEPVLLRRKIDRLEGILKLCVDAAALPHPAQLSGEHPYTLFAVAPASVKVFPKDMPVPAEAADAVRIDLARGEFESAQVVVLPLSADLDDVEVSVSALRTPGGETLPAEAVEVSVVGHVLLGQQAMFRPPDDYKGWYPDPILDFTSRADIPQGDSQSFWLRIRAPRKQAPGAYTGRVAVKIGGAEAWSCPVDVRVRAFAVPRKPPMDIVINFDPVGAFHGPRGYTAVEPPDLHDKPASNYPAHHPVNLWLPRKMEWVDFLADYGITYKSHGSTGWEPDFEVVQHLKAQGRLGLWNLGVGRIYGQQKWHFGAKQRQQLIERLRKYRYRYDRAKELGLIDENCYTQTTDEVPEASMELAREFVELVREAYPGLQFLSAGGRFTGYEDILVPEISRYVDPDRQAEWDAARAQGKRVLWYIAHGIPPYPGIELEAHAMEPRLMLGAMQAEHRPDGFLFWQSSIWNAEHPIAAGPYTHWPAISHIAKWSPVTHGNGQLTCVGPDGIPLSTIRLESLRDGFEDYAYVRILEETLRAVEANEDLAKTHREWIKEAKHALDVPGALGDVTTFITDPDLLYAWRRKLADAIEAAPVKPVQLGHTTGNEGHADHD
jgi:hypothetical protein